MSLSPRARTAFSAAGSGSPRTGPDDPAPPPHPTPNGSHGDGGRAGSRGGRRRRRPGPADDPNRGRVGSTDRRAGDRRGRAVRQPVEPDRDRCFYPGEPVDAGGRPAAADDATPDHPGTPVQRVVPAASLAIPTVQGNPVPAGNTPGFAAISPDGHLVYIANRAAGYVTVVDTTINQVVAQVPVPAGRRSSSPSHRMAAAHTSACTPTT